MANIESNDRELLASLVQRSLGLLSEVREIEKQMRQIMADLTISGIHQSPRDDSARSITPEPTYRGSMRWNRRE